MLAALLIGLIASPAQASPTQESTFQDDNLLVFNDPGGVAATLDTLRSLGVERIRVSVFWAAVAPGSDSKARPAFDASDPGAYPAAAWAPYDRVVALARARNIAVYFDVTSPAPFWATGHPPRPDIEKDFEPSASEFGLFVRAVGRRYSGTYVPSAPGSAPAGGAGAPLPRVDYWSIWNEPNQPGWLTPQWTADPTNPRAFIETAPRIYRSLVDAGAQALTDSGHGQDTILVGETAPKGLNVKGTTRAIKPLDFIRRVYCLDDRYRPLTGAAASQQGCPTSPAESRAFPAAHPGLFAVTGWAHHPYELTFPPTAVPSDPDYATIANLPRLSATLNAALRAYGQARPGGLPLYLTEFGYLTKPPSPLGVTLAQQSAYSNQSEFIAYNNPSVRTLTQFLLVDDKPKAGARSRLEAYGGTFQTGLEFLDRRPKPAFASYRLPVFLPSTKVRRGHKLRVWGLIRPAPRNSDQTVTVEFRARGRRRAYRAIAHVHAQHARAYVDARVRIPGSGSLRLAWTRPSSHETLRSRAVAVRAR